MIQSAFSASAQPAPADVAAELVVPPAETYVIGDQIPLYWRFTNHSTNALGFMWEGCCRVNGRLTIARNGQEVTPIPAVQAMAHMFAKAEVLAPNKSKDYETFVSDWAVLPESGTYDLSGRYIGVLETQKPQVPRGIGLWRDTALTGTNRLSVLSVTDYLKQRSERVAKRGLSVELSGPLKLPLLDSADWSLRVRNTGTQPRTFRWPDDLSLWVVDAQGFRETRVPSALDGDYSDISLSPGQSFERKVMLEHSRVEDLAFGRYQLFIDLSADAGGAPRVPSNPLPLQWEFSSLDVSQLVLQAASGNKAGLRNPALKFLRVHLAEFGPLLKTAAVSANDPKALELLIDLSLAAAVKPFAPQPGRKDWEVTVKPSGSWMLTDEKLRDALDPTPLKSVQQLLGVKRHLGLEMNVLLRPEGNATAATWFTAAKELSPIQADLAAPVHLRLLPGTTNTAGIVNLRSVPVAANVVILLTRADGRLQMRLARKFPEAQGPVATTAFSPGDFKVMTSVASSAQLLELISDPRLRSPQVQVFCPNEVTVAELGNALEPLWTKVNQVDLVPAP
ncbi:MAG TPA: hypothetical protein VGH19_14000 [Verrucomicrobiae bacterium]